MQYVQLTEKQAKRIPTSKTGYTSGKRNKATGLREQIKFCSRLVFVSEFGYKVKKKYITI